MKYEQPFTFHHCHNGITCFLFLPQVLRREYIIVTK